MPFADGSFTIDEQWVNDTNYPQPFPGSGLVLVPFQLRAHLFGSTVKRPIISLDKGLGKTIVYYSILEPERVRRPGFATIIVTTTRGINAFRRDIAKFPNETPGSRIQIVRGSASERWSQWRTKGVSYFITTYASYMRDCGGAWLKKPRGKFPGTASPIIVPQWALNGGTGKTKGGYVDAFVCDEFHRMWRRRSPTWKWYERQMRCAEYVIQGSGSAVRKGPEDLFPALHISDRKRWSSYWRYCAGEPDKDIPGYCQMEDWPQNHPDGPNRDHPEMVAQWRKDIAPYVFHRTKKDVGDAMVGKTRSYLDWELPDWQRRLYRTLVKEMVAETDDGEFIFAQNTLQRLHKLRTLLICPRALAPGLGMGGGIEAIWEDAQDSELTRFGIFTPFRAPIPHLEEWLTFQGGKVTVLWGGISPDEQESRLEVWRRNCDQATPSEPAVCLYTIKYGESWEIPEASYGYALGYEWDREENLQAEDRMHRLISRDPVYVAYARALGTHDEKNIRTLIEHGDNVRMMWKDFREYIEGED